MFRHQPVLTLQLGVSLSKASKNVHIVDLTVSFPIIFPKKITRDLCKDLATRILIVELFYKSKISKNPEHTAIENL